MFLGRSKYSHSPLLEEKAYPRISNENWKAGYKTEGGELPFSGPVAGMHGSLLDSGL